MICSPAVNKTPKAMRRFSGLPGEEYASPSSIPELSSFHYQATISSPNVSKTLKGVQRSSAPRVEDYPAPSSRPEWSSSFHYQATISSPDVNRTPKVAQRLSSASCVEEQPSPFKLLEDVGKSLLPLVEHCELPSISPDLLKSILAGEREFPKESIVIIDTRHQFEYCGGHINGAVNLNGPNCIEEFYARNLEQGKDMVIIFHCEFSFARAPKLFRHMRNLDRQRHLEVYPALAYPHMYILHGGYKAFFYLHPDLCEPKQYIRMADPSHVEDLRASNRILKRSWSARSKNTKNCRSRTQEDVLADVSNMSKRTLVRARSCSTCLMFGK
ncbi:unnamed protein product [Calypogeia fissa]